MCPSAPPPPPTPTPLSARAQLNHTFNDNQITWFKHGSALNAMGAAMKK